MRFVAERAGRHWSSFEWLAALCEEAALWEIQAEAARLIVSGHPIRQLAPALSQVMQERINARRAQRQAWEAGVLIRRTRRDLAAQHRREARVILACVRNISPAHPGLQVYAEKWGTVDREPVRFRSRLDGEHPDDLVRHPIRFLRDLGRLYHTAGDGASGDPAG